MTRTISNAQRNELFDTACSLEKPLAEIKSYTAVLLLMVEGMQDELEQSAVNLIAHEIREREHRLSEVHGQLFHGLHETPRTDQQSA